MPSYEWTVKYPPLPLREMTSPYDNEDPRTEEEKALDEENYNGLIESILAETQEDLPESFYDR